MNSLIVLSSQVHDSYVSVQEKYRSLHPRLPVIVAESILNVDRHMELPLWLVNIFKASFHSHIYIHVARMHVLGCSLISTGCAGWEGCWRCRYGRPWC
jgi:hypothetical protein